MDYVIINDGSSTTSFLCFTPTTQPTHTQPSKKTHHFHEVHSPSCCRSCGLLHRLYCPPPGTGLDGLLAPVTGVLGGLGKLNPKTSSATSMPAPAAESALAVESAPTAESISGMSEPYFQKRSNHVDSVIDAIVKVNTDAVVKLLAKLELDVCTDIHSKLHLTAEGILTTDTDVNIPKVSAKIKAEINAAVHTKIDADAKAIVLAKIHSHAESALLAHCPLGDDACIISLAAKIVASVEAAVKVDVDRLFVALRAQLDDLRPRQGRGCCP